MSLTVEVIVDPNDDVGTTRMIHQLAVREPGVLAVSIAPGTRTFPAVIWAILRAMGKRIEQLERPSLKVWWTDAERWLTAHGISEVVVLGAQHLGADVAEELERNLSRLGVAPTFVHGGTGRSMPAATTTLGAFLGQRRAPRAVCRARHWPRVPRSHPLRLRYDCWRQLAPEDFARVELLLHRCVRTLGAWRWTKAYPTRREITRAVRVVRAAHDPEQAYIRRCGVEIALIRDQYPVPRTRPLTLGTRALMLRARPLTSEQIEALHAYTDPATAGYHLAKLITGLPDDMLSLVGGDQITDDAILGCPVPEQASPVLRALEDKLEPVLGVPDNWTPPPPIEDAAAQDDEFALAVGWLLRGRSGRIPADDVPAATRARLDQLQADGILELSNGAYLASHVALYSSYQSATPPISALTNE